MEKYELYHIPKWGCGYVGSLKKGFSRVVIF